MREHVFSRVLSFFCGLSGTTPYEIKRILCNFLWFSLCLVHSRWKEIFFCDFSISSCPVNYTCLANVGPNPNNGYTSFDNIGWALLMAFQILTMDYWENLYHKVTEPAGAFTTNTQHNVTVHWEYSPAFVWKRAFVWNPKSNGLKLIYMKETTRFRVLVQRLVLKQKIFLDVLTHHTLQINSFLCPTFLDRLSKLLAFGMCSTLSSPYSSVHFTCWILSWLWYICPTKKRCNQ